MYLSLKSKDFFLFIYYLMEYRNQSSYYRKLYTIEEKYKQGIYLYLLYFLFYLLIIDIEISNNALL